MNEFNTWVQDNWYSIGSLFSQFVFLAVGIWFARKILRTMRASQEQVGALLKLSVTGAATERLSPGAFAERQSPSAVPERSFGSASPYWLTPAEAAPAGQPKLSESSPSQQAGAPHGLMVWLNTPMRRGNVAPWRKAIKWLQTPAGS